MTRPLGPSPKSRYAKPHVYPQIYPAPVSELILASASGIRRALLDQVGLAYAVVKMLDAGDEAEILQGGFAQAAAGGMIPEAYTVGTGIGFLILIVGTVLVVAGGLSGLRNTE